MQQRERDVLRLTAAEYQALQARWAQDTRVLAGLPTELAKERERRERAETNALRAGERLEALEPLLAKLQSGRVEVEASNPCK